MEEQIFKKAETSAELRAMLLKYADSLHEGALVEGDLIMFIEAETLRERVFDLEHEAHRKVDGPRRAGNLP